MYSYSADQNILIVGDANFSFSLALAGQLAPLRKLFVCATKDSCSQLESKYRDGINNVRELRKIPGEPHVYYDLDGSRLSDKLPLRWFHSFDRIIWNFPFHNKSIRENQRLILHFLISATSYLCSEGEIHIRLCNYQSEDWQLAEILHETHLEVARVEPFEEKHFHGYTRRCENEDKEWEMYPASAKTFVIKHRWFGYEELARKILLGAWNKHRESLHSECAGKQKRKRTEEPRVGLIPPISDQTQEFLQEYVKGNRVPVPETDLTKGSSKMEHHVHVYLHTESTRTTAEEEATHPLAHPREEEVNNPYTDWVNHVLQ